MQPVRPLPAEAAQKMIEAFSAGPDAETWTRVAYCSQLFTLDSDLMQCVRQAARGVTLGGEETHLDEGFLQVERACAIAAVRRDAELARAIGTVLLEYTPKIKSGQEATAVLCISILAAAAFEDEPEWAAWLEEQLAAVAFRLPRGKPIEAFGIQLAALKEALPLHYAIQARAEALCSAAA